MTPQMRKSTPEDQAIGFKVWPQYSHVRANLSRVTNPSNKFPRHFFQWGQITKIACGSPYKGFQWISPWTWICPTWKTMLDQNFRQASKAHFWIFLVVHLTFLVRLLARKAIVMRIHQETLAKAEQNELRCLGILHSGPATVWCQFFFFNPWEWDHWQSDSGHLPGNT